MTPTVTSTPEVTNVSKHGFWLLLDAEELLVPFERYPRFTKATIEQLTDVQWPTPDHLHGLKPDADLSAESTVASKTKSDYIVKQISVTR